MPSPKPPLIAILGPTAVGKTQISIQLAQRLNGEIVSADSRLFYRGMDIGTAKPSPEEMRDVPHHLVDVIKPDEEWSLAQFQQAAHTAIGEIHSREKLPFLVGGSGQYMRAITAGWAPPAVRPNPQMRSALEAWGQEIGVEKLHERLALIDPQSASRMDPRNLRRIVRALEVILLSGRRFSKQVEQHEVPYEVLQIGLTRSRASLYQRIDKRLDAMLEAGWEAEVERLLAAGYGPELPSMSAIGYAQLAQVQKGEMERAEALRLIKQKSRAFVRRQANWFKLDDPAITWFDLDVDSGPDQMEATIRNFLGG